MGRFEEDELWKKSLKKEQEQQNLRKLRRAGVIRKIFLVFSFTAIGIGLCFLFATIGAMRLWGLWIILGGIVTGAVGILVSTDIKAVKTCYFENNGSTFHMSREDSDEYALYDSTMPVIFGWDRQLLKKHFKTLWDDPETVWLKHDRIIEVLDRKHICIKRWASRLLDEMEKMDSLDVHNKILIIENMCGRDIDMEEGGVHLICTRTRLEPRMVEVMDKLINSCSSGVDNSDSANLKKRYSEDVKKYKKAYERFRKSAV